MSVDSSSGSRRRGDRIVDERQRAAADGGGITSNSLRFYLPTAVRRVDHHESLSGGDQGA